MNTRNRNNFFSIYCYHSVESFEETMASLTDPAFKPNPVGWPPYFICILAFNLSILLIFVVEKLKERTASNKQIIREESDETDDDTVTEASEVRTSWIQRKLQPDQENASLSASKEIEITTQITSIQEEESHEINSRSRLIQLGIIEESKETAKSTQSEEMEILTMHFAVKATDKKSEAPLSNTLKLL